jgi:acyl-CoA reductase-like NAD-dependent aldehyde dehydrogenase
MEETLWRVRSPGDLSLELPEVSASDVETAVRRSQRAFADWRRLDLDERKRLLSRCRDRLKERQEDLARLIAIEVGKPLREARLELGAVVAKFEIAFLDAERFLTDQEITDGPHPAVVRRRPRGPAAVVAPFNFPIHLGHGAAVAYLLAGNTVIFKPSPLAGNVCAAYASLMQAALPEGVFELVQGWTSTGRALCSHPDVRSVCFTGSIRAGRALAQELAADYSKSLALELGGKNALIVFADADLVRAADAAADGICLTTGQRCNSTSRILVHRDVRDKFSARLLDSLHRYVPGDPTNEATTFGPLVSERALERYERLLGRPGEWLLRGEVCREVAGKRGYYVKPGIVASTEELSAGDEEIFSPVASLESFETLSEATARQGVTHFGLTASVFTSSEETFHATGEHLEVGNLYWNLPTTFSPSTLPFGGFRASGNGKPGARGFVRFAADEQAVQWSV